MRRTWLNIIFDEEDEELSLLFDAEDVPTRGPCTSKMLIEFRGRNLVKCLLDKAASGKG